MERFAMQELIRWKDEKRQKPMIIRGARQVGKTWLMKEFGRTQFAQTAYVNLDENVRLRSVFEGSLDIERLVLAIQAETGIAVKPENTLLILDEIQEVPRALTSLKYFCENAPEYALFQILLLAAMSDLPLQVLMDKNRLFTEYKGALTEVSRNG